MYTAGPPCVRLPKGRVARHWPQWVVLRDDGATTAADYSLQAAQAGVRRRPLGGREFMVGSSARTPFCRRSAPLLLRRRRAVSRV